MPATTRRRPLKRSSSLPSSSPTRRNADTKNLVTATAFRSLEVGDFVRALLLGAVVGGLVIFLLYPDISGLLERWHNSSELSQLLRQTVAGNSGARDGDDGTRLRSVDPNKERQNSRPRTNTKDRKPAEEARKTERGKKEEDGREHISPGCPCPCQCRQQPVEPPSCRPPAPSPPRKAKEKIPKEDLMEEEEEESEVEEEDSVELELMEEEDPVEFIDLEPEENAPSESPAKNVETTQAATATAKKPPASTEKPSDTAKDDEERVSGERRSNTPSVRGKEEPIVLTDGQPITFTPVSPGDENVIRMGGRPKSGTAADSASKPNTEPANPRKAGGSSGKPTSDQSSGKARKREAAATSDTKRESGSKKKGSGKPEKKKASDKDPPDLPEEVKNFRPSFLKTVSAKKIFADGRRIPPVELLPQKETNSSVKVFLFNDFLSEAECDGLRRVHDKHVQEMASKPLLCFDSLRTLRKHLDDVKHDVHVTPNDFVSGTKCLNGSFSRRLGGWMGGNWSYSTAFYPGESRFSAIFAARVQQAMGLGDRNGGKFQITSYPTGKAYKAHTDCVLEGRDPRDRVATVLVYLDDVEDGGETKFPELGIWVKPRKGRALVWNNMSPEGVCEPHSLHVASKVNSGSKYILIRWYYYKSFYSLGKRPPEPPLPARSPGTPRVSCDDYDNGSCRWYDEWNNDHLLDYEYKKYTLI